MFSLDKDLSWKPVNHYLSQFPYSALYGMWRFVWAIGAKAAGGHSLVARRCWADIYMPSRARPVSDSQKRYQRALLLGGKFPRLNLPGSD
jgi:hypothetical protein